MKLFNLGNEISLLSIFGSIVIFVLTMVVVGIYVKQMKTKKTQVKENSSQEWDGICEDRNPLPVGWAITFIIVIIWAIWYLLFGYPLNSFSQIGMYNDEIRDKNIKFESKFKNISQNSLMDMGQGVYLVQCSQCHGISGDGMNNKAADLNNFGNEKYIVKVILNGSKGLGYPMGEMPGGLVNKKEAEAIAAFVAKDISAIKKTKNENLVNQGKELWTAICASCHGDDGKGLDTQAPDLTKYGSSKFVKDVLNRGKEGFIGKMPAFKDSRLSDIQKMAVGEFINSFSQD